MKVGNICNCVIFAFSFCPIPFNTPAMKAGTSSSFRTAEPPFSSDTRAFGRFGCLRKIRNCRLDNHSVCTDSSERRERPLTCVRLFHAAKALRPELLLEYTAHLVTMHLLRIQLGPCTCMHACTSSF